MLSRLNDHSQRLIWAGNDLRGEVRRWVVLYEKRLTVPQTFDGANVIQGKKLLDDLSIKRKKKAGAIKETIIIEGY
jgi:hypothetical protein